MKEDEDARPNAVPKDDVPIETLYLPGPGDRSVSACPVVGGGYKFRLVSHGVQTFISLSPEALNAMVVLAARVNLNNPEEDIRKGMMAGDVLGGGF